MANQGNRRKQLIIMPDLQYGMMRYVLAIIAFLVVAQSLSFFLFMKFVIAAAATSPEGTDQSVLFNAIADQWVNLFVFMLIPIVAVSLIAFYLLMAYSNRIAGPIYKINRSLEESMSSGAPIDIKLRTGDYFQELAENINKKYGARKG